MFDLYIFFVALGSIRSTPSPEVQLPPDVNPANISFGTIPGQDPPNQGAEEKAEKEDDGQTGSSKVCLMFMLLITFVNVGFISPSMLDLCGFC